LYRVVSKAENPQSLEGKKQMNETIFTPNNAHAIVNAFEQWGADEREKLLAKLQAKRDWRGLSTAETKVLWNLTKKPTEYAKAIEAKLRERNEQHVCSTCAARDLASL
jgi:hypothetical protein